MQAEKSNKTDWINNLIDSFRLKINDPYRKVDVVDVQQEARLSHLGIVPESKRYSTFLIDIGSGNTKGGFFPYGDLSTFRLFQLNWGTKSVSNATEKDVSMIIAWIIITVNYPKYLAEPKILISFMP